MTLSHTSALVLLMLKDKIYQTAPAKDYLAGLDLSVGIPLYTSITDFFPDYDEVIQNRKIAVLTLIKSLATRGELAPQIILPAIGMDAMGLEIATLYPDTQIYELDQDNMAHKKQLINHPRCRHITADITNAQNCYAQLISVGWQADVPSLIIMEGISYYISPEQLKNLLDVLHSPTTIIEYHTPPATLSTRAREISYQCFSEILGAEGYAAMSVYTAEKLARLLNQTLVQTYTMTALEKMRHGSNKIFKQSQDGGQNGWIEISLFARPPLRAPLHPPL